ncbi:MAG: hypothetical protein M1828_007097 [Chrysothrix sp. TS-e1954]|nr:MAG: hypothetical protein M1828_007097 [Chrysothrix sp. TS-e1954]
MADSTSDADRMRNKRLAKLNSSNSSEPRNEDDRPSERSTPPERPAKKINIARAPTDAAATANPFSQLGVDSAQRASLQQHDGAGSTPTARTPRPSSQSSQRQSNETVETWENKTLSNVFRVSFQENAKDSHGARLYFLRGLRSELSNDPHPLLNIGLLDQAIIEAGSDQGEGSPLDYLLGCWKRITRLNRSYRSTGPEDPRLNVLKDARRICLSYAMFSVTLPDMFGREAETPSPLAKHLLQEPESERGICHDFLTEAVSRFSDDDSIKEAFVQAMEQLSAQMASKNMTSDYKPYIMALRNLVRFPAVVTALSQSPYFVPAHVPAQNIEKHTLLGPFFQISPLQGDVALSYFSAPKTRDRANIMNSQHALRMTLQAHHNELFEIINQFIKAGKESREKTLDWFALCVNSNHKRRAMRPDDRYISSDGFMVNITVCLDMLCEPFMDATFSKINRIESEYFRRTPRVQISDETKINADDNAANAFYNQKAAGESNFISEVFFLAVAAHHYGTEAANAKLTSLRRELKHLDKQLEKFEQDRNRFLGNPLALARFDQQMKRFKDSAEKGHCVYHAIEGVLQDELSQARSMSLMRYVIVWMMRLVSGVDFPRQSVKIPLSQDQPEVFKCLPEYFVEDVVDHFKFVTHLMPHVISPMQCDEIVMVCITFLRSSEYIKNPYLKSGLVSILHYGVYRTRTSVKGVLGDVLNALPFALEHLLHALMQFYIECESTGAHTQFYDKFNIRYEIFQVIKCIWSNVVYRENLATEAKINVDFFVRFVNLLLNDATFVLDESFTSFNKIRSLTNELKNAASMEDTVKQEKEEELEETKGKAKSYMGLTTETMAMLKLFTDALADSFTKPEVVQRLADMLDYNLDSMVGPKSRDLAIENREEYNFNPKALLSDFVEVYLNLSQKENFHRAIARDGRSYKPANFDQAVKLLGSFGSKSREELNRFEKLRDAVNIAKIIEDAEGEDLVDAPDEFLDPLLATLMEDPVNLPTSKNTLDRSTIQQHLLSDPHDPFNRVPLKLEDVVPNTELKAAIDAWREEKRAARLKAAGVTTSTDPDAMDTT